MEDAARLWQPVFINNQPPAPPMSIDNLLNSVQLGADVRIRIGLSAPESEYRLLPSVTVSFPGPIVSGMVVTTPALAPSKIQLSSPPALEWAAFNSTGMVHRLRFDGRTSSLINNSIRTNIRIQWFVNFGFTEAYQEGLPTSAFRNLVDAVKDGAEVKISYAPSENVLWVRSLTSTAIHEDPDEAVDPRFVLVTGMLADIPDTELTPDGRVFSEPFAREWQLFNTNGRRKVLKFDKATSDLVSSEEDNPHPMIWWVRK